MIHRAIRVRGWTVDFLFASRRNDAEGVIACLRSYGAPAGVVAEAESLMDAGPNCGFTFSNGARRSALTWVGPQRCGADWVNTSVHEIVHLAMAIALDLGLDPYSESLAYLVGDISEQVADVLCSLACDHCREEKID